MGIYICTGRFLVRLFFFTIERGDLEDTGASVVWVVKLVPAHKLQLLDFIVIENIQTMMISEKGIYLETK